MPLRKSRIEWAAAGFLVFAALSLVSAWFNVQAVRWSYQDQRLRVRWDDLRKNEQSLDRRLHESLSLDRLDRTARERFRLQVPSPDQIVLVPEKGETTE